MKIFLEKICLAASVVISAILVMFALVNGNVWGTIIGIVLFVISISAILCEQIFPKDLKKKEPKPIVVYIWLFIVVVISVAFVINIVNNRKTIKADIKTSGVSVSDLLNKNASSEYFGDIIKTEPTPTPTETPTPTVEPTSTPTVEPEATPTLIPKSTETPVPTLEPKKVIGDKEKVSSKPIPVVEPTPTLTPRPTATPIPTIEPTPIPKPKRTPYEGDPTAERNNRSNGAYIPGYTGAP